MNRMLARVATLVVAIPFATAMATGAARASDPVEAEVPGCWGAGDTIVCDVVVSAHGTHTTFEAMYVKVCAGECHDIPVTWVDPGLQAAQVCYSYEDIQGGTHGGCLLGAIGTLDITEIVVNLFDCNASNVCAHQ